MATQRNKIFEKIMCVVVAMVLAMPAFAAVGNGCDDPDNIHISPTLALCSTHVYNIGDVKNPTDEGTRQLMQDVVALKSTIITQQMYKQYEYLNATVRRLKTQLQKAVLTSKLEAAGATSSDGGASGGANSYNRYVILNGTNDCSAQATHIDNVKCLQSNLAQIRNAVTAGNYGEAKKQLKSDIDIAVAWDVFTDVPDECNDKKSTANSRDFLNKCIQQYTPELSKRLADIQAEQNKSYYRPY